MKGRVLIIQNGSEHQRTLSDELMKHGYAATICSDGISAFNHLIESQKNGVEYDYLVTDFILPDINGFKLLKAIKNRFPSLAALVTTGFAHEGPMRNKALSEYNAGYLEKPFETAGLVASLEKLPKCTVSNAQVDRVAIAEHPDAGDELTSAYLMLRIIDNDRCRDIFDAVYRMDGVRSCDAVTGCDIDIVARIQADSMEKIDAIVGRIRSITGVEVSSTLRVKRVEFETSLKEFIKSYSRQVEKSKGLGGSFIFIDIDKEFLNRIYARVLTEDEVISCEATEGGSKLIVMTANQAAARKMLPLVLKLKGIDGVLRIREAKIIHLYDS